MSIGIGDAKMIDSISVIWPDQSTTIKKSIPVNKLQIISKENSFNFQNLKISITKPFSRQVLNAEKHKEDVFVDYNYEQLVTKMLS